MNNYDILFSDLFKDLFYQGIDKQIVPDFKTLVESCEFKSGLKLGELSIKDDLTFWYNNLVNLDSITELVKTNFEEIIIHSPNSVVKIKSDKTQGLDPLPFSESDFQIALEIFALKNKVFWNFSNPFVSFGTEINGIPLRITMTHYSIKSTNFSKVFIRRQSKESFSSKDFKSDYNFSNLYEHKKNIIITGATGSGKTTFLKALLNDFAKESEHILILEDTKEINCKSDNWTQLIGEEKERKTLKDYCHYALRMRPERMILGEIRSKEVVPFMLSMNNGHKGLMASLHANSAIDAIDRLSLLFTLYSKEGARLDFNLVSKLICQNLDYVIHIENKVVKEIVEIKNFVNGRVNYQKVAI